MELDGAASLAEVGVGTAQIAQISAFASAGCERSVKRGNVSEVCVHNAAKRND